jgi:peroxiredoxin
MPGLETLSEGETHVSGILPVVKGGILSGRITDSKSGGPRSNIIMQIVPSGGQPTGMPDFRVVTDAQGKYAFRLPPGEHGLSIQLGPPTKIHVQSGQTVVHDVAIAPWGDAPPQKPRNLAVTVVGPTGKPVPYASVLVDMQNAFMGDTVFHADGNGKLTLTDYEYRPPTTLRARAGGLATAAPKTFINETEGLLKLQPNVLGSLTGKIEGTGGQPFADVPVMLFEKSGTFGVGRNVVRTDKSGRYRFEGLWPDFNYSTAAYRIGWIGAMGEETRAKPGATATLAPIKLRQATGSVAGRVVDSKGEPIGGASVNVGDVYAITDRKGGFRISGIEDRGFISVYAGSSRFGNKPYRNHEKDLVIVVQEPSSQGPGRPGGGEATPAIGSPAPELLATEALDGKPIHLADFKSHVVVLDFWGIHCGPCVGAIPSVQRLWNQYSAMGVVVIGLHNSGESLADIKKFVKDNGLKYSILPDADDDAGSFGKTFREYGVFAIPSVVVIDQNGKIAAYNISADDAFNKVGELLAK